MLSEVLRAGHEPTAGLSHLSTPDSILMCYPLILALSVVGLSPFPRFWRLSRLLTAYTSLAANAFLAAHAITACALGTMVTPLPSRILFVQVPWYRQSHVFR